MFDGQNTSAGLFEIGKLHPSYERLVGQRFGICSPGRAGLDHVKTAIFRLEDLAIATFKEGMWLGLGEVNAVAADSTLDPAVGSRRSRG